MANEDKTKRVIKKIDYKKVGNCEYLYDFETNCSLFQIYLLTEMYVIPFHDVEAFVMFHFEKYKKKYNENGLSFIRFTIHLLKSVKSTSETTNPETKKREIQVRPYCINFVEAFRVLDYLENNLTNQPTPELKQQKYNYLENDKQINIGNNSNGNFVLQGINNANLNIEIKNGLVTMENKLEKEINDFNKMSLKTEIENINGKQRKQFLDVLNDAYPKETDLEILVSIVFDKALNQITKPGTITSQIFELINWAKSQGKLEQLLIGAVENNPTNKVLLKFAEQFIDIKPYNNSISTKVENTETGENTYSETFQNIVIEKLGNIETKVDKIDSKLDNYNNFICNKFNSQQWTDIKDLEDLIIELNENIVGGFTSTMNETFDWIELNSVHLEKVLEDKYQSLFSEIKKSSNFSAKVKFVIPLLSLFDIMGIPVGSVTKLILETINLRFEGEQKIKTKFLNVFGKK